MKKLIPILILLISLTAWSQTPSKDRIRTMKVGFITERIDLTQKEAQQFWPIYNAFDDKTSKLRNQDLRQIKQTIRRNSSTLSDAEADELLNKLMRVENDLHNARVTLVNDLKKVISSEKIIKLRAAEDAFNKWLLEQLKRRRQLRKN